jgi:hypothetical protein
MSNNIRVAAATLAIILIASTSAQAIDKCKVKVDKKTGVLVVSAIGVSGTLQWGAAEGAETEPFFNAGVCVVAGKAKKCEIADPATLDAKTPPSGCTLYLDDDTAPCSVWIAGCTPGSRGESAVCGDGNADGSEACDGADLSGQTCQSAGFLYGALSCSGCALDTSGCTDTRFQDNGDGTVTDHETNLMWEQKTDDGTVHDKDNLYLWSTGSPYNPDGSAFFEFLAELNGPSPFTGRDDWRLPTITELESILDPSEGPPRIDESVFGPTASSDYWSSTTVAPAPDGAWGVFFDNGTVGFGSKAFGRRVRAVRGGL